MFFLVLIFSKSFFRYYFIINIGGKKILSLPENTHFNLGFGYKYQYLLSFLIFSILEKRINLDMETLKKLTEKLKEHNSNPTNNKINSSIIVLFRRLKEIVPDKNKVNYKNNCLLMLEGETPFFEDINFFLTQVNKSSIYFMQVKGTMAVNESGSLDSAIISTLSKVLKNPNFDSENKLFILINKAPSNYLLLKTKEDKEQVVIKILREINYIKVHKDDLKKKVTLQTKNKHGKKVKRHKQLGGSFYDVIDEYLETIDIESSTNESLDDFIKKNYSSLYNYYKKTITREPLLPLVKKIYGILENVSVLENLDHRLICLFLQQSYTQDEFLEKLWDIEVKCMDSTNLNIKDLKDELLNIQFDIKKTAKIQFSQDTNKVSIGKII